MRQILIAALVAVIPAAGFAQDGNMGPADPWFQDFEATCRIDTGMEPECQTGVIEGYKAINSVSDAECNWPLFWETADRLNSDVFRVLPWQYAVEAILAEPGVCSASD